MLNSFPLSMWYMILVTIPLYALYRLFYAPFLFLKSIKLEKVAYIYWYLPRIFFLEFEQLLINPFDYFKSFKRRWKSYRDKGYLTLRGTK